MIELITAGMLGFLGMAGFLYANDKMSNWFSSKQPDRSRVFDPPSGSPVPSPPDSPFKEHDVGSPYREPAPKTLEEAAQNLSASVIGLLCPACKHAVGFHDKSSSGCRTDADNGGRCKCAMSQADLREAMGFDD